MLQLVSCLLVCQSSDVFGQDGCESVNPLVDCNGHIRGSRNANDCSLSNLVCLDECSLFDVMYCT